MGEIGHLLLSSRDDRPSVSNNRAARRARARHTGAFRNSYSRQLPAYLTYIRDLKYALIRQTG